MTWIFNSTRGSLILMVLFHESFDLVALVLPTFAAVLAFRALAAAVYWMVAGIVILRYGASLARKPAPVLQAAGGSV